MSNTDSPPLTPDPQDASPRGRRDGWTAARRRQFLDALAEHGVVRSAAAAVGMDASSAYRMRRRAGFEDFAAAWDRAIDVGFARLQDVAVERAVNGVRVPIFYKGEAVGERVWHDNRLLTFLLSRLQTRRFSHQAPALDREAERAEAKGTAIKALDNARIELMQVREGFQRMIDDSDDPGGTHVWYNKIETIDRRIAEINDAITAHQNQTVSDNVLINVGLLSAR
jgi:hypothetical protein